MTLDPGTLLGPYEISHPLGKGGMGEVYRARDTRLGREVAIKVLPPHLRSDADLRERLEQEAKAISQLKHPNICTLYDLGHQDGIDYLVMELLDGETLQERLSRGPLSVDDALTTGATIAGALDRAHRGGVVHRDLKPANVMLTADGPKVLDFGLAKDVPKASASVDTASPTALLTQSGEIVGTLHYMAPEQLEGKEVDGRADVFAFGCVLFEMLTGERAFDGESQASLIAAVLERPAPSLTEVEGLSPLHAMVVGRCLAKSPERRWQSLADVKTLLDELPPTTIDADTGTTPRAPATGSPRRLILAGLGIGLAALLSGLALGRLSAPEPVQERAIRRVVLERTGPGGLEQITNPALSRDGKAALFVGGGPQGASLFLRRLDRLEPEPLAGTESAGWARFSADGQWIVYFDFQSRSIERVPIYGGASEVLAEPGYLPFDLRPDGTLYYVPIRRVGAGDSEDLGITRLEPGASPELLTRAEIGEDGRREIQSAPSLLPGGRSLLFSRGSGFLQNGWETGVLDLQSGEWKRLLTGVNQASYVSGYLVFWRAEQLWAAPFDVESTTLLRAARPVLNEVAQHPGAPLEVGQFHVSETGSLVYVRGGPERALESRLLLAGTTGSASESPQEMLHLEKGAFDLTMTPDGRWLGVTRCRRDGASVRVRSGSTACSIWIRDLAGGEWERVSPVGMPVATPLLDHNGRSLVFVERAARGEPTSLLRQPVDSSSYERLLVTEPGDLVVPLGVDAERRVVVSIFSADRSEVRSLRIAPDGSSEPLVTSRTDLMASDVSTDGRWLLLQSEDSAPQLFLARLDEPTAEPVQLTIDGGVAASFGADDDNVYFRTATFPGAAEIVRASLDKEAGRLGSIETVTSTRSVNVSNWRSFLRLEPMDDGVLYLDPVEGSGSELVLVENWIASLDDLFEE